MALREEISRYLRQTRGLVAPPENIVVGSGAQTLYNLIVQLIGRNRTVGVEDPGYPRLRRVYGANNVRLSPIPLDASGVSMASVRAAGVDTLHITPSHQFPTGIVTSVSRRHELLGWRPRCLAATLLKMITTASFAWLGVRFLRFRESSF